MRRVHGQPATERLNLCLTKDAYQKLARIAERERRDRGYVASSFVEWVIKFFPVVGNLVSLWESEVVREERIVKNSGSKRGGSVIEKHVSLRTAARQAGIDGKTLKNWMELDLGIRFPKVVLGSKLLVRERDVEFVLAKRRDARNPRRQART